MVALLHFTGILSLGLDDQVGSVMTKCCHDNNFNYAWLVNHNDIVVKRKRLSVYTASAVLKI